MTKGQMEKAVDTLASYGYEVRPYDEGEKSYSGRGMYGKTTYAVVVDCSPDTAKATLRGDKHSFASKLRGDNLGLDYIIY